MRKIISVAVLLFLFQNAMAQNANISGRVMDQSAQQPLPGVSVIVDNSTLGTTTDADGNYSLAVPMGKHSIQFSMVGMKEKKVDVDLQENENKILIIILEENAKELGLVVVSASKFEQKLEEVTVSMNVIKPSAVETRNITSMDDMLDQSPSVSVIDGQANIRGGSGWSYGAGSRVLILVDDLPMLTADAGDAKWSFLPVENLEQIEVIKGASSALYGSSALNGVINVRTAYPKSTPMTNINVYSGFYDANQKIKLNDTTYDVNWAGSIPQHISGINFLHSRQIKNLDLVVGGHMLIDEGYRQGEYEDRGRINFNLRYRFKHVEGLSCGMNVNTQLANGTTFFIWQNDTTGAYRPYGGTGEGTTLSSYTTHRTNLDPFITYVTAKGSLGLGLAASALASRTEHTRGYLRAEGSVGAVRNIGGTASQLHLRLYGGLAHNAPRQRSIFASSQDPFETFRNDLWRARGALFKRDGFNYLPIGGAALRGFKTDIALDGVVATNVEFVQRLLDVQGQWGRGSLSVSFFGDAGNGTSRYTVLQDNSSFVDGGAGLVARGRIYDRPVYIRLDAPVFVNHSGLAGGTGLGGKGSIARRWMITVGDIW